MNPEQIAHLVEQLRDAIAECDGGEYPAAIAMIRSILDDPQRSTAAANHDVRQVLSALAEAQRAGRPDTGDGVR